MGFWVSGLRFRNEDLGFKVLGLDAPPHLHHLNLALVLSSSLLQEGHHVRQKQVPAAPIAHHGEEEVRTR